MKITINLPSGIDLPKEVDFSKVKDPAAIAALQTIALFAKQQLEEERKRIASERGKYEGLGYRAQTGHKVFSSCHHEWQGGEEPYTFVVSRFPVEEICEWAAEVEVFVLSPSSGERAKLDTETELLGFGETQAEAWKNFVENL
jgi:hypothetical protein